MSLKRCVDFLVAIIGLILLSPIILIVAASVRLKLGSPIFFRQERPGLNGKSFEMIKFRTMLDLHGDKGAVVPDSERMTTFGAKLRSTSIDELPSLWNVLKGDMSLVGPRPLLVEYLPLYSMDQRRRHEVKPGITGWAQVNGRNAISWDDKFKLDVWYVDNVNFILDMKILVKTIKKIVIKEGISADGEATMPKFKGGIGDG